VRTWEDAEGWGVLDSAETPGGCWVHWSCVAVDGFRALLPGQEVELEWEQAEQDGCSYRALRAGPAEVDPVEHGTTDHDGAWSSRLTVRFDDHG